MEREKETMKNNSSKNKGKTKGIMKTSLKEKNKSEIERETEISRCEVYNQEIRMNKMEKNEEKTRQSLIFTQNKMRGKPKKAGNLNKEVPHLE